MRISDWSSDVCSSDLYHAAPKAWSSFFLRCGASVVIDTRFDAERLLATIEAEKVTHLLVVPTMFALLLKLPQEVRERHDLSSLRFVLHGAAPCSPHLKKAMLDWWGPCIFKPSCGARNRPPTPPR